MSLRPPPRARVAQLAVTCSGRERRGSGYLIGASTVLTAAHVVEDAESVVVRFEPDLPGERLAGAVSWRVHPTADFAVVNIAPGGDDVRPATFGRVSERAASLQAQAVGFPRWKLRRDDAPYRDAHHAVGEIAVLSNYRSGSLEFLVPAPPAAATDGGSPWEGMSGAAVWVAGRIVGVISEHHSGDGLRRLTVARLDLAAGSAWDLFALPDDLPDVAPLSEAEKVVAAYRAAVTDTAPAELVGRSAELAELARFSAGNEPYAWWQAGPWAGKSALLSWFVLHPPDDVDVVAFFISRGLVGESDSDAFLKAMIEQLAVLAGESPGDALDVYERRGQFLRLLSAAAAFCVAASRRLMLVVDGLDEDTSSDREGIVALLPQRLPAEVRVLIASRPIAGLNALPSGHPLRSVRIRHLSASSSGEHEQITARSELDEALRGDPAGRDVLGLVTASGGGLSLSDLIELTGRPTGEVTDLLARHLGHTIDERGSTIVAGERGYAFTHETLREMSHERQGGSLQAYRERLRSWAAGYRIRGWPTDTPAYLLHGYPRLLAASGDLPELVAITTDQTRHERLLASTGGDLEALTEISSAVGIAMARPHVDLAVLLRLALARHALAQRNEYIPVALPAVWARLGRVDRAVALANSLGTGSRRVNALCRVAATVADGRVAQILGSAEKAVGDCETAIDEAASLARLAAACAGANPPERARELIDAARRKITELRPGERLLPTVLVVAALVAVGERDQAARLAVDLTRETTAHVPTSFGGRAPHGHDEVLTLRRCASVLSDAGFPDCSVQIAGMLREETRYFRQFRTEEELARTYRDWTTTTSISGSLGRRIHLPRNFVGGSVRYHVDALDLIADTIDGRGGGLVERVGNLQQGSQSRLFAQAAMVAVVESLVAIGEQEQAEQLARWRMAGEHAAQALVNIADRMVAVEPARAAELVATAEATARKAGSSAHSDVRGVLATELAMRGDDARAKRLAPTDGTDDARPNPFASDGVHERQPSEVREAVRLVAAGQYGRAERLVCEKGEVFPPAGPIAEVAAALVKAGQLRRAEKLFKRAHLSIDRGKPMAVYAAALARAGRLREVKRLEKDAFFPDAQFLVQTAAAEGFAVVGDVGAAAEFAERAAAVAAGHSFPNQRQERYLVLARIWAAIGDRGRAHRLIDGIREPVNRIAALAVFATHAAHAGNVAGVAAEIGAARTMLDQASTTDQRTQGLVRLAAAVFECEEVLGPRLTQVGVPASRRLIAEAIDSPGWLAAIPVASKIDLAAVQALADTLL